jgi:hypothetical protein
MLQSALNCREFCLAAKAASTNHRIVAWQRGSDRTRSSCRKSIADYPLAVFATETRRGRDRRTRWAVKECQRGLRFGQADDELVRACSRVSHPLIGQSAADLDLTCV